MKGRGRTRDDKEPGRLRRRAEESLRKSLDPGGVVPLLHQLAKVATPESEDAAFAHQKLAELLAEIDPWRAALYAKRVLSHFPANDGAWAVLALTQSMLENFRFARKAYERALELSPHNPSYAHNLGHLLDVALRDPSAAVPWLARAYRWARTDSAVAASYAHALGRSGLWREAERVVKRALGRGPSRELAALARWVEAGLADHPDATEIAIRKGRPIRRVSLGPSPRRRPRAFPAFAAAADELDRALRQGLLHLPFSAEQRARARTLARDATEQAKLSSVHLQSKESLAAAIAYAIVFVDEVPLTHAEVAAPFRVRVAQLRGCFAELRAELCLMRGDARYAT
jgi:tetratricopeptide (TPR) repeat protein